MSPPLWVVPGALAFLGNGAAARYFQRPDAREAIVLDDGKRAELLAKVRARLCVVPAWWSVASTGNRPAATSVARASGPEVTCDAGADVADCPLKAFITPGLDVHADCERIADVSVRGDDGRLLAGSPAAIPQNFASCDARYRVRRGALQTPSRW